MNDDDDNMQSADNSPASEPLSQIAQSNRATVEATPQPDEYSLDAKEKMPTWAKVLVTVMAVVVGGPLLFMAIVSIIISISCANNPKCM